MITLTALPYVGTDVVIGRNVAANPSVETSSAGWDAFVPAPGAGSLVRLGPYTGQHVTPDGLRSGYFLRLGFTAGTAGLGASSIYYGFATPIVAGASYSAGLYVRAFSAAAKTLHLSIAFFSAADVNLGGPAGPAVAVPNGAWTRLSLTGAVAPAGAVKAQVNVFELLTLGGTRWAAGDTLDADYLIVESGPLTPYFDGSWPAPAVGQRYRWAGTVGASASELVRRDYVSGYRVEVDELTDYRADRQSSTVLHELLGGDAPLPALGPLRRRRGQLQLWHGSQAAAWATVRLHSAGAVFMLRDPANPELDMYYVAERVSTAPDSQVRNVWLVTVDYVEVASTAGSY